MLNRLQLWLIGKKPNGKNTTYLVFGCLWFLAGIWFTIGIFALMGKLGVISIFPFALSVLTGLYSWYLDKSRGYIEAIQAQYLLERGARVARLQKGIK